MSISVNTMRAIDHWVGVPLCAVASPIVALMDGIKSIFSRGPDTPRKLLFIELSEMGSAIERSAIRSGSLGDRDFRTGRVPGAVFFC